MFTTTEPVHLGQKVYGISEHGRIVPTLINEVSLQGDHKEEGGFHFAVLAGRLLTSFKNVCCTSLDEAFEDAVLRLEEILKNDQISVQLYRECQAYLQRLTECPQEVRDEIEAITVFSRVHHGFWTDAFWNDARDGPQYTQADFPSKYHELGTEVWLADVNTWELIRGIVTKVSFEPRMHGSVSYTCGAHSNLPVFLTKEEALEALACAFEKKLPGTLDRDRVRIVGHLNEMDKRDRNRELFRRISRIAPPEAEP